MKEVIFLHLPELLLLLGVVVNTYNITIEKGTTSFFRRILIQNYLFIFILLAVVLYTLNSLVIVDNTIILDTFNTIHAFKVNKTTQLLKIILCASYLVMNIIVTSLSNIDKEVKLDHILVLNILILNSFFIIGSNNFIELLLCLEINTVAFLILSTTKNYQLGAIESAFKYFLVSAVSAAFYLLGVFVLWSLSGHIRFEDIRLFLLTDALISEFNLYSSLGVILIISSLLLKLGFYPMHKFIVDFYGNAPFIFLPFFQVFGQLPILIITFFLFNNVNAPLDNFMFSIPLVFFGLANIIVGTIVGSDQDSFKRYIANSSIQFNGLSILLLALLEGDVITVFVNYLESYLLSYFALMLFLASFQTGGTKQHEHKFLIDCSYEMTSLNLNYMYRFVLFLLLVAITGIPLTFLFLSKSLFFVLILDDFAALFIVVVLVFLTVYLLQYYITFFIAFMSSEREKFIALYVPDTHKLTFLLHFILLFLNIICTFLHSDFGVIVSYLSEIAILF